MIPTQAQRYQGGMVGWQSPVLGSNTAVAGSLTAADLDGNITGRNTHQKLAGAGALATGTYYYYIPISGAGVVDVTLRTSASTGTGLSSAVTLYTVLSDSVTQKGTAATAAVFVNGTAQTLSITTLHGEQGVLLKIIVPGASSVTFDIADFSAGQSGGSGGGGGGSLTASEAHIGEVGNPADTPSNNFTRPADTTAYASGDLVANSVTAGSVVPLTWTAARVAAGSFMVRRARLAKTTTTTANANFRLHLYGASPTPTNGDNAAWLTTTSTYLGSIDLDLSGTNGRVFSDGAEVTGAPGVGSEITVKLGSGQAIFGLLEARAAYVPGLSEVITVTLELLQN